MGGMGGMGGMGAVFGKNRGPVLNEYQKKPPRSPRLRVKKHSA
jgi:hypothetical protein